MFYSSIMGHESVHFSWKGVDSRRLKCAPFAGIEAKRQVNRSGGFHFRVMGVLFGGVLKRRPFSAYINTGLFGCERLFASNFDSRTASGAKYFLNEFK